MRQLAFAAVKVSCSQQKRATAADKCAENSERWFGSIRERAVFRLHFVVLEHNRDRVFALAIDVRRLLRSRRVLDFRRSRLTQDRFHLFLRHPFRDLIHIRLGDSVADTRDRESDQNYKREARKHL